jgi:hypothetical protein
MDGVHVGDLVTTYKQYYAYIDGVVTSLAPNIWMVEVWWGKCGGYTMEYPRDLIVTGAYND